MPTISYPYPVKIVSGWPTIIDPGSLRHAIKIEQEMPTDPASFDESGEILEWKQVLPLDNEELLAAIAPYRGTDVSKNGQTTTKLNLMVVFWWRPGVLPNMRVIANNGSKYIIEAVENVLEMDVVLILYCLGLGLNT